jgi:hypothetical protein
MRRRGQGEPTLVPQNRAYAAEENEVRGDRDVSTSHAGVSGHQPPLAFGELRLGKPATALPAKAAPSLASIPV